MVDYDIPDQEQAYKRALSLSDGVFAVAITLAVFQLVPTDLGNRLHAIGPAGVLRGMTSELINTMVSFIVVGLYWLGHQRIFSYLVRADRTLLSLNMLFLGSITFLPFSTQLLSSEEHAKAAVIPYALNMAIAGYTLALLWKYASGKPNLLSKLATPNAIRYCMWRTLVTPSFFLLSIGIAFFSPSLARYSWVGIFLGMRIVGRLSAVRG